MREAIDLMYAQLHWDPSKRISAVKALQHPYFEANAASISQPDEGAAQCALPKVAGVVPAGAAIGAEGADANAPVDSAKLPRVPVPLPSQKDFPANFLLNNLNGTQGSRKDKRDGSQPSTGKGSLDPLKNAELPPLLKPPGSQKGQDPNGRGAMGSSRYLRMARYQPGMMQTPVPSSSEMNAKHQPMNGSIKLPSVGATPSSHGGNAPGGNMFGGNNALRNVGRSMGGM